MQSVKLFLMFMLLSVYLVATAVWFSWGLWAMLESYDIVGPLVSVVAITITWMVFSGCAITYLIKWYTKAARKKALLAKTWPVVLPDRGFEWAPETLPPTGLGYAKSPPSPVKAEP